MSRYKTPQIALHGAQRGRLLIYIWHDWTWSYSSEDRPNYTMMDELLYRTIELYVRNRPDIKLQKFVDDILGP